MDSTLIENPRLWRLILGVTPGALHAVMISTVADASMIYKRLPLDTSMPLHRAIEEVVYANPDLLADFGKINILVDTPAYTLVPADADCTPENIAEITQIGYSGTETPAVSADVAASGVQTVWAMPEQARQFLARTFRNAPVQHSLTMLLKYLGRKGELTNRARVFAHLTDGSPRRMDIIAYDSAGKLTMSTSKEWETETDARYYIIATARTAGFDAETDELLLCGDSSLRHAVTSALSRYVRHVMPLIFPSAALRAGKEAFKAPFPLIILPLCE